MVQYQVHITVRHEIYETYVKWMQEEHIHEVLRQPGFISADLCLRKGGSMESSSKEVKVVYLVESEEAIKAYLSGPALELRQKGTDLFPGMFSAQREVWLDVLSFR